MKFGKLAVSEITQQFNNNKKKKETFLEINVPANS